MVTALGIGTVGLLVVGGLAARGTWHEVPRVSLSRDVSTVRIDHVHPEFVRWLQVHSQESRPATG